MAKSLSTFPLAIGVSGKSVVEGAHDLIHALHISDARVELGIDEQDPFHHLPVGFTAIGQNLILVQGRWCIVLVRGAHLGRRGEPVSRSNVPIKLNLTKHLSLWVRQGLEEHHRHKEEAGQCSMKTLEVTTRLKTEVATGMMVHTSFSPST